MTRRQRLALVLIATLAGGCNLELGGPTYKERDAVDLGAAVYPPSATGPSAANHKWASKLTPSSYRVAYSLDASERASIRDAFQSYARSVGYAKQGDSFRWNPPRNCVGDMHCAYENAATRGSPDLEPLVARFAERQKAANLSAADLAALIVTFVQNIRYEEPKEMPFGVLPPALVVAEQRGDCDSKSLLGHMLLRSFGIDSVLVTSRAHHHAMLAIALPSSGTKVTYSGRQYAYTEMTAKGSPIGYQNPKLRSPNDWKVVPVSYALRGGTPAPNPPITPSKPPPSKPPSSRR